MNRRLIKILTKDKYPIASSFGLLDYHTLDIPHVNRLVRTVYLFLLHITYSDRGTYLDFLRRTEGRYGT